MGRGGSGGGCEDEGEGGGGGQETTESQTGEGTPEVRHHLTCMHLIRQYANTTPEIPKATGLGTPAVSVVSYPGVATKH
jgi:hypothetical protein